MGNATLTVMSPYVSYLWRHRSSVLFPKGFYLPGKLTKFGECLVEPDRRLAAMMFTDMVGFIEELKRSSKGMYVPAALVASVYAALGKPGEALGWLGRLADDYAATLCQNLNEPTIDGIHSNPRFQRLLEWVGLAD